jgi:hypothetical protein
VGGSGYPSGITGTPTLYAGGGAQWRGCYPGGPGGGGK